MGRFEEFPLSTLRCSLIHGIERSSSLFIMGIDSELSQSEYSECLQIFKEHKKKARILNKFEI